MASYFDQTIQSIQHQRWHGQCSEQSLAAFQSTGYHSCLLRVDGKRTEAVKLCALRNLRSVDERLSPEELSQWEGAHPSGVLHVGRTPVMTAIWVDAFDGLHELRNAGASFTMRCPQDDDFTALHYAVKLHRVDMIRYILPLLPRPQLLARTRHDGDTPLHLAARYGHYDIVGMFMAHATKLYSEDTFVWKQLNSISSGSAVPPTSSLICQMILSKSRSDGCTAAHLIAQCRTATMASEDVSVATVAGGVGRDFATPTALAALSCLLDCADEHDSMIPLLSSPQLRTSSGEHLLAACESPVLWQLVKSWCDRCGYEVSWSSPPALSHTKSFAGAKGLSWGVGATDEGEDEESLLESLLALRSRRASLIDSEACPNILLPLLTSDGDTPLHRLAEKANLTGGLGMVRLWLHCLVAVFPPSPYSSPTSVDPQWRHCVRDDAYTKVLEFASPRTGKSAWSTVIEAHGADNYTAQDMMNVALELDAQHEAATKQSQAANEGLFAAAEGAPLVAVSDLHVEPVGGLKSPPLTIDPPPTSPLLLADPSHRPSPLPTVGLLPPPPIQTLQSYKLLTVFDNKRNARRLAHHLAYHSTPAAGLQWLRDSVIAELCKAVRVATQSIMMSLAATAADAAAKAEVASSVGRPISAGSALPSTPLVATKSQRGVSPPNNKDDGVSNPASQMLSPMTDRPRSRGAQFVDDANNASFRSTGSNETNHSRTTNGADIDMTAEYEGTLTALSGQLLQLASLYNDVLLSVDQDGFQPLFLAALRDNGDAVAPLCDISDAIASEALNIVLYMAQITAQMTKARRAAAAAAQAALDAAAAAKAMRRSNSNLKRTPSMSTNQQNSSSLQRVSSTSAMQQKGGDGTTNVNFSDAEALAVSQSGLALSASFAVAAGGGGGGGGGGAARPPSLLVRDVREALQQPQLIPQEFHPLLDAVLGELELNYAHAFQKEQEQNAAEQLRLQQQAATLETSASEVVVPPPPAVVNSMRGAGASSTGSTAAITPVEDPAVAAQRRRAAALEALEWDGLMGSSPSTAEVTDTVQQQQQQVVPFVVTTLNGAAAAQTIGVLLRAHHPIRVATSVFHQAVEAGGWSSSRALLSAVLTRWASETQRTVVQRDLASSMDVPRPTLEQSKSVLQAFLCNTGSDTNQHRSPMQIAVRRGDFRTVHSLTSLLMERVGREHRSAAEHHHHHIAFPAAALQERSLVGVIDAMTSSWNGGSGAFTSCAPLTAEALGHCLLSPTMSPTKRLVIIGAGTPIRAEPLTTMESSLYVASTGADDDDGVNNQLDDDVASMCCNGNGDHPVVGATYHQMHHHMAAVRCRCWLMMSDIHQLLAICHRVE